MCPKCRQLLCETCILKSIETEGTCYSCKKPLEMNEIKQRSPRMKITMNKSPSISSEKKMNISVKKPIARRLPRNTISIVNVPSSVSQSSSSSSFTKSKTPSSFTNNSDTRSSGSCSSEASVMLNYNMNERIQFLPSSSLSKDIQDIQDEIIFEGRLNENETTYIPHINASIFDLPNDEKYITFSKDNEIESRIIQFASLEKCLYMICSEECKDIKFLNCFVCSYKLVVSTCQLVKLLIQLFHPLLPENCDWQMFMENILIPIRSNIYRLLKLIIETYPNDMKDEDTKREVDELIQLFCAFNKFTGDKLQTLFNESIEKTNENEKKQKDNQSHITAKILPEKKEFTGVFCISPFDFAEQMTLIQQELFEKIPPEEFLNQGWTKKNKEELTPNLVKMIQLSNKITRIVQTEIVMQSTYSLRSLALYYWITVADTLRTIHNYDGMKTIVTALLSVAVYRLKVSWAMLNSKTRKLFDQLVSLCSEDNNFAELRKVMKDTQPPTLPFIGSTLTDIIYTSDGNKSTENGMINFFKLRTIGNLIRDLKMKQKIQFNFPVAINVKDYINSMYIIDDEEQLFTLSQKNEAKVDAKTLDLSDKQYKSEAKHAKELYRHYKKKLKKLMSHK